MLMNPKNLLLVCLTVFSLVGCNVGEAPHGSEQDVKAQFNAMTPEDKIKFIQSSPMQPAEKQKQIDEIKRKAGITGDTPAPSGPPQHG
ncbi:hypothetical protein BH11ARM2_BH11ARM2_20790 [soil metagenome]